MKEQTEAAKKIPGHPTRKSRPAKKKELKEQSVVENKSTDVKKETVPDKEPDGSVEDGVKESQDQVKGANATVDINEAGPSEVNERSVDDKVPQGEADPNDA